MQLLLLFQQSKSICHVEELFMNYWSNQLKTLVFKRKEKCVKNCWAVDGFCGIEHASTIWVLKTWCENKGRGHGTVIWRWFGVCLQTGSWLCNVILNFWLVYYAKIWGLKTIWKCFGSSYSWEDYITWHSRPRLSCTVSNMLEVETFQIKACACFWWHKL